MMRIRTLKILRDLFQERARVALVLLALIVGGWGVASVIASTTIVRREVRDNFLATNPLHATISFRGEGDVVADAEAAPWVESAELRSTFLVRARGGFDGRLPVMLKVVDDFENLKIATFKLESGRWPEAGEIVLERDDLTVLGLREAPSELELQTPSGEWVELPVSGVVHDAGVAPARMEHLLYVYAPRESAQRVGVDLAREDVIVRMLPPAVVDRELAYGHAELLGDRLSESGYEILDLRVPEPNKHPHEGQISTALFVQYVFGGFAMLLSVVVVINMISSLMQRHVHQIGVLKTIGGVRSQVAAMYFLMIFLLSLAALAVTLPMGFASGVQYAKYFTAQLNFDMLSPGVPASGWALFIGLSLVLPLLAASIPVLRGIRATIRDSLGAPGDFGAAVNPIAANRLMPMSLRNILRRPARTALTAIALAIGLGALISAFHVGASMRETMDRTLASRQYDMSMVFERPVEEAKVVKAFASLSEIIPSWKGARGGAARLVRSDGRVGDPFTVIQLDPLEKPSSPVVEGTWRVPPEGRAILVNTRFAKGANVGVGDVVTLRIDGVDSRWPVVGVLRQLGGATQYLVSLQPLEFQGFTAVGAQIRPPTREDLEQAAQSSIRLGHGGHGSKAPALAKAFAKYQASIVERVEAVLEEAGIPVRMASTSAEVVAGLEDHIYVMTRQVAIASLVIIAVGGLGLASSMSVSVLERTRELGVLRSLGATPVRVARFFASESAAICALSLFLGAAVSVPLGRVVSDYFGERMFQTPLDSGVSVTGVLLAGAVSLALVFIVTVSVLVQVARQPSSAALRYE